jgi:hypothetical protein
MSRIVLLGGMLVVLAVAGATTLTFMTSKPEKAPQQLVDSPEPLDPSILHSFLQRSRAEMALP